VSVRELPYFIVKFIFGSQNGSMSYDRIESFVTHFMSFDVYRYSGPWAVGLWLKRFLIIFFDNGWNVSNSCLWFDLQSLRG
jgi:hypothetical protein